MKTRQNKSGIAGFSLVEVMMAMAVLAVMLPLGLAAISTAGSSRVESEAETLAVGIADYCLLELRAARRGEASVFREVSEGESFPGEGEVMALAFGDDGRFIGVVEAEGYHDGLGAVGGEMVDYFGVVSGVWEDGLMTVEVAVEFPAVKRARRRSEIPFYTRLP